MASRAPSVRARAPRASRICWSRWTSSDLSSSRSRRISSRLALACAAGREEGSLLLRLREGKGLGADAGLSGEKGYDAVCTHCPRTELHPKVSRYGVRAQLHPCSAPIDACRVAS
eukprot:scaffold30498_cov124-Isochrysis_galbana.AAC.2